MMMERQHRMLTDNQEKNHSNSTIEGKRVRDAQEAIKHHEPPPPSSSSSSPSHEFSFTVPLHPPPPLENQSPPAIDLSPADEIFFHGHLLPLHFLSNFPSIVSPRSSTNSLDSFTLPIKELSQDVNRSFYDDDHQHTTKSHDSFQERSILQGKGSGKSKSFSLFGLPRRRKESSCDEERETKDYHQAHDKGKKRKSRFDIGHVMQRYMRLIKPFLSFRNNMRREKNDIPHGRQGYSLSCNNLRVRREKGSVRGRRGELFSAPASMITSPTNSGLLVGASGTVTPASTSDSTMEELQAAIQAAIAHCKKSNNIATHEDKFSQAAITL